MQKRKLGNGGLEVFEPGLGCMSLNFLDGKGLEKKDAIPLLGNTVERGISFFNTAEAYGPYTNEQLVGQRLQPYVKNVVIATKFGCKHARPMTGAGRKPSGRWPKRP